MAISSHLLERAHQLIDANQIESADLVLEAVVRVEPTNVDAWKIYFQIHQNLSDLEWLKDRVLRTRELSDQDKFTLVEYQNLLVRQLEEKITDIGCPEGFLPININFDAELPQQDDVTTFELMDVFDYPVIVSIEKKREPRPARKWYFPELSVATKYGLSLLFLFYCSIRLLVGGYFIGYILMAGFFSGGIFWIKSYGNQKSHPYIKPVKSFTLESKNNLSISPKTEPADKKAAKRKKK